MKIKIGDVFNSNNYGRVVVIAYNGCMNVFVRFEDGTVISSRSDSIVNGAIRNPNPNIQSVEGVGYLGHGPYSRKNNRNAYEKWRQMISRCFNEKEIKKFPRYGDCSVCTEWLSFQVFCEWYEENKIECENTHLDKDLLVKGNKVYSPQFCSIVPHDVNGLLVLRQAKRGLYPLGVCLHRGSYCVQISVEGRQRTIGKKPTALEAFIIYKAAKEVEAERLAEKYKGVISSRLYTALKNLNIDHND